MVCTFVGQSAHNAVPVWDVELAPNLSAFPGTAAQCHQAPVFDVPGARKRDGYAADAKYAHVNCKRRGCWFFVLWDMILSASGL